MKALCLGLLLLLPVASVSLAQIEIETRLSADTSGQLRMLAQRASAQYLMFQYGVGSLAVTKEPLLITVERLNAALRRLSAGETGFGAGLVTSPEIKAQLKLIAEKWDRLEKIYTYQPYKLFQAKELLPPAVRKQDPVLVRYVDRLTQELLAECDILIDAYVRQCRSTDAGACQEQVREASTQMLLIEEVTSNLLFTLLDIDRSARRQQLAQHTERLQASLDRARAPGYFGDNPSVLIEPVLETIAVYWGQMRASVNLALEGDEDDVDVDLMLRAKQRLLEEIDQLTLILAGR